MSDAVQTGILAAMPAKKLLQAGYSPLSRFAITLSRIFLMDPGKRRKFIVPRRPITVLSIVKGTSRQVCVSLHIVTGRHKVERGAVSVSVEFLGFLGRSILPVCGSKSTFLFADPIDAVETQNLYFDVPKGAFWAKVTLSRHVKSRRIGIEGSLRLKRVVSNVSLSLEEALASRDRRALEHHLAEARLRADRQTGLQLLARLAFLERTPTVLLAHRLLEDCDRIMMSLAGEKPFAPGHEARGGEPRYLYSALFSPYSGSIALSRWLKSEAISLNQVAGTAALEIPYGSDFLLRVLVARFSGRPFRLPEMEQKPNPHGTVDIPWIKSDEVLSI